MKKGIDTLYFQRLHPKAQLPRQGSEQAAGYDVAAVEPTTILPWTRALIPTGLAVAGIPKGHYLRIAPRSGLATPKKCIDVGAGVVDADYRGPIFVILINASDMPYKVESGSMIAQFILEKYSAFESQWVQELPESKRGKQGFGSTDRVQGISKLKRSLEQVDSIDPLLSQSAKRTLTLLTEYEKQESRPDYFDVPEDGVGIRWLQESAGFRCERAGSVGHMVSRVYWT
jgi:dUTP pyrophosphatase